MPRTPYVLVPAVALLAVGLAACSAPEATEPTPTPTRESAPAEPAEPAEPEVETYPVGVMEEFLAEVSNAGAESSAEQLARLEAEEETVAACMHEQGFSYTPLDWSSVAPPDEARGPGPQRSVTEEDLEFAAQFGYGIAMQPADAGPPPGAGLGTPDDPNAAYVEAMSPAEEEAYYLALWGPGQGEDYVTGDEPYDWTKYGCTGVAGHESGTDTRTFFDETPYEALRVEIDGLWATIDQDPRIAAANQAWSQCMESAGFPGLATAVSAQMAFRDEDMRIIDATFGANTFDLSTNDYLTSPEYLAAEQAAAEMRAAMLERETATAVADLGCQEETDYRRVYAETSAELQQAFYDAHRTDLEAWRTAAAEAGSGF